MKNGGLGFMRIVIGLFITFAVVMACYYLYTFNFVSIKTEDAVMGEMERVIKSTGIFVRDEQAIDNDGYKYLDVIRTEGERVSDSGIIARVYSTEESAVVQKEIRNIDYKISTYEEILENSGSYESAATGISQSINSNLKSIASLAKDGNSLQSFDYADELVINIMKRKIASGDLVSYDAVLDELRAERNSLKQMSSGSENTIISKKSGYFSLLTDGHEDALSPQALENLTVDNFEEISKNCDKTTPSENVVGKMVYGNSWSICMKVPSKEISALEVKNTVYIRIPNFNNEKIKCTVTDIRKKGDEAILVLSSSVINGNILTLRKEEIHLILETYDGIIVRHSALRKVDGEDGVYVKAGLLLKYKKVKILYNDGNHAVIDYVAANESGIRVHDQVVYKGSNLYDRKAVS